MDRAFAQGVVGLGISTPYFKYSSSTRNGGGGGSGSGGDAGAGGWCRQI